MFKGFRAKTRDGLEVVYFKPDHQIAQDTLNILERSAHTLAACFQLLEPLPSIRAILAPNRPTFDRLVDELLGICIERPSDPRRVAQTQRTDMVLLSPSAYETQSAYADVPDDYARMVTHEMVHVFQEFLSPDIERSPLWWDEGLAVYLSNQWQFESQFQFREPVLEAVENGQIPSWADVQTDPSLAYSFGWTLVRYIEHEWGKDTLVRIITQMDDGSILSHLGEDDVTFERGWHVWLQKGGANPHAS